MKIKCQRSNEEIRDGLPGHGHQEVVCRFGNPERVLLECGCHFLLAWLPTLERLAVLENVPPANIRTRIGKFKDRAAMLKRLQELQDEGKTG